MPKDMQQGSTGEPSNTSSTIRPYRSHKVPACAFCRKRKVRCNIDIPDRPCQLCRRHGVRCVQTEQNKSGPLSSLTQSRFRGRPKRTLSQASHSPHEGTDIDVALQQPQPQSEHVIGPTLARDVQILEQYISPVRNLPDTSIPPNPYNVYSDDPKDPVVSVRIPRHRVILPSGNGTPGFRQFEILEKILEPHTSELLDLFIKKTHPAFPILDERAVVDAFSRNGLPHALSCEIYAMTLLLWRTSPKLASNYRPDIRYVWNLTVSALHEDFQAPSFSTVLTAILDLTGRPTTLVTYNATNIGRVVALALTLGLNRNPSKWNLDQRQKSLRIRAWWALLIHDSWASLAHGTPPLIKSNQHNVPLPELDTLMLQPSEMAESEEIRTKGAQCFIALCQLTRILGDILPWIYDIDDERQSATTLKAIRKLESRLDEWEDSIPRYLNFLHSSEFDSTTPGVRSLQVCYHTLKIGLYKVALHETLGTGNNIDGNERIYYDSRCRKSAQTLIDVVVSFEPRDWHSFWLPYCTYFFSSAATLMLRGALEAESDEIVQSCRSSAHKLITYLRYAKSEADWDLADIPLAQCESIVQRMLNPSLNIRQRYQQRKRDGPPRMTRRDVVGSNDGPTEIHVQTSEINSSQVHAVHPQNPRPNYPVDSHLTTSTGDFINIDETPVAHQFTNCNVNEDNAEATEHTTVLSQEVGSFAQFGDVLSGGAIEGWYNDRDFFGRGNIELLGVRDMSMVPRDANYESWAHPLNMSFPNLWDMFRT